MKKKYTKKQIQEAINYWQKQLKTMNESEFGSRGFKNYFSTIDVDPDISDEDMDDWYDDFRKSFSSEILDVERYIFDVVANNILDISERNELLKVCRGYLNAKDALIKWQKKFCELCDKLEMFNGPTEDHAKKNGYVIYGTPR